MTEAKTVETAPEWLTKTFLEKALRSYRKDETLEILNFTTNSSFSEHFASSMFQSKIDFKSMKYQKPEPETLNVVIKIEPMTDDLKIDLVTNAPMFENEIRMYSETLPVIHSLLERSGIKNKFGPELIYASREPHPILILEDLSPDGYAVLRSQPDELDDSKLMIERLAQFHAASFFLIETGGLELSNYNYTSYDRQETIDNFFKDTLLAFREVLETWDDYKCYLPKLDYFVEHVGEIGRKCYVPNKPGCGFNVLNHGDFHLRNILVKNNSQQRIEDVVFIDYQISVLCSPAIDLSYMFGVVKLGEDGDLPTQELILFYHQKFVEALKVLGYMKPPPTLLDLNVEILKHGAIQVLLGICFTPFSFVDWSKMSADDLMGNDSERSKNFKKSLYNHPICSMILKRDMKSWVHKGWF